MMHRRFRCGSLGGLAIALLPLVPSCASGPTTAAQPRPAVAAAPPEAPPPSKAEPIVELPRSPLGLLARSLVAAVNAGKVEAQREFVRARFCPRVRRRNHRVSRGARGYVTAGTEASACTEMMGRSRLKRVTCPLQWSWFDGGRSALGVRASVAVTKATPVK